MTIPRKDYLDEIAAAYDAGDLKALRKLAFELAARDAVHVAKLDADVDRKRQRKENRKSKDSKEIPEIRESSSFSPGPPFSPPTSTTASTAREASSDADMVMAAKAQLIEALGGGTLAAGLVERYAAAIPAERAYPWLAAMGAWLDPEQSEHYTPAVMLAAMNDWLVADRARWPWEGRKFRAFCRDIDRQREPRNLEVVKGGNRRGGTAASRTVNNGLEALKDIG